MENHHEPKEKKCSLFTAEKGQLIDMSLENYSFWNQEQCKIYWFLLLNMRLQKKKNQENN